MIRRSDPLHMIVICTFVICSFSSSSSDEAEDDIHRVGASGGESAGSGGGNGHSKYRRHRSKRIPGDKDGSLVLPGGSPSDKSGTKLVRRRRRRSLNGGTSPAPIVRSEVRPVERLSAFLGDADGEDEGVDREDSPEHIYQRIDEVEDDHFDVGSKDRVYRAVPASSVEPKRPVFFGSDRKVRPDEIAGARAYVTTHQPTRVPRKYSLPKGNFVISILCLHHFHFGIVSFVYFWFLELIKMEKILM